MVNIQNKVIHRFIRPISEYEEGGLYANNIIPLDVQAYAFYSEAREDHEAGLYFVFGDGQHTYTEIREGKSNSEGVQEYAVKTKGASEEEVKARLEELSNKFDNELEEALKDVIEWSYYPDDPERKAIVLANHDSLTGTMLDGDGANLVMLSKWNVADFGSTKVHFNLNTKDTVTINDDKVVATLDDVKEAVKDITVDEDKFETKANAAVTASELNDKLDKISNSLDDIKNTLAQLSKALLIIED